MFKQIALGIVLLAVLNSMPVWADEVLNKALFDAVQAGDKAKVEMLISKGADVNAKALWSRTPLHNVFFSYSMASFEVAKLLISKGADVNAKDIDGITVLHLVAASGEIHWVEFLISKGADLNAKNNEGNNPWITAYRNKQSEVATFLISKGANVNAEDDNDMTPQDIAEKKNKIDAYLQVELQNQASNQRENFNMFMINYGGRYMDDYIRSAIIVLAAKLKPAPAVPEEARRYLVRGNALMGDAKNPGEARAAVREYKNALLAAPWWDDAYFNLSKAQELAGDLDGAYSSMQYYLLTEPQDKREAQDRLYAIEAKRDKAKGK